MALKLTEYELNYSTYLWIFKGKSSRNYKKRNRGVTLPDFMKIFHENFENELGFYNFFYKTYNLHKYKDIHIFLLEPPNLCFLRKEFGTKAFKLKPMKEDKRNKV